MSTRKFLLPIIAATALLPASALRAQVEYVDPTIGGEPASNPKLNE